MIGNPSMSRERRETDTHIKVSKQNYILNLIDTIVKQNPRILTLLERSYLNIYTL